MVHLVFIYYVFVFYIGVSGISVSAFLLMHIKDRFIRNYLIFFGVFGLKVLEMIVMLYVFSNLNKNETALHFSYLFCAGVTLLFYISMLWVINEACEVPNKRIRNIFITIITIIFMFIGLASYRIDITAQKLYFTQLFYLLNGYCIGAIIYVIYIGLKYTSKIKNPINRKTNRYIINLFIAVSPFTIIDSIALTGRKEILLGEGFSLVYFLPVVYSVFVVGMAIHISKYYLKKEEIEEDKTSENEIERSFEIFVNKFNISNRERELLEILIRGMTNSEIAESLNISVNTVKSHLNNIYDKVGVRKRLELISIIKRAEEG